MSVRARCASPNSKSCATRCAWRPPSNGVSKKTSYASLDHLPAGEPFREREHVRVVVSARQLRRVAAPITGAQRIARHLIRRHRDAEARAADDDAALGLPARDRLSHGVAILRIVDRRRIVRAEVENLVTLVAQHLRDAVFVFETGVIGAEGDLHEQGLSGIRVERRTPMKLACASGAFDRAFERGDLTQLEFLDAVRARTRLRRRRFGRCGIFRASTTTTSRRSRR